MEGKLIKIRKFFLKTMPNMRNYLFIDFLRRESSLHELNKNQHKTILILKNHGPKSMTELCSMLQLEKGSFTTIIDYLTQKEYVMRTKDEKDRRKYVIKLTEIGNQFAEEQTHKLNQHLMHKFHKLSKENMEKFLDAIEILEEISNEL